MYERECFSTSGKIASVPVADDSEATLPNQRILDAREFLAFFATLGLHAHCEGRLRKDSKAASSPKPAALKVGDLVWGHFGDSDEEGWWPGKVAKVWPAAEPSLPRIVATDGSPCTMPSPIDSAISPL